MNNSNLDRQQSHKQQGFTLVELLVGLFLSLFIAGVAITYFVSSSRTFKAHTSESVVQENARFALEVITQNLRLAGRDPGNNFLTEMNVIYSGTICPSTEASQGDGSAGSTACTKDGADDAVDNNSDRIAVDYVIDATDEVAAITATGCNNHEVTIPAGSQLTLASVMWTADLDGDQIRSLYCQTYNLDTNLAEGAAVPLVDGVDRLQVQYGADVDGDGVVDRYQSFTNLGAANSQRVRTVRVALLLNAGLGIAQDQSTEERESRTFTLLDAPAESINDSLFRQIYTTTVLIPNSFQ